MSGPWRNPCPVCGGKQPPCGPECCFRPPEDELDLASVPWSTKVTPAGQAYMEAFRVAGDQFNADIDAAYKRYNQAIADADAQWHSDFAAEAVLT